MAEAIDERDVFTAVYRDMAEREVVGWQNHGKPLLFDDGRDWLQEAYEECLDMAVYLKARIMERAAGGDVSRGLLRELRALLSDEDMGKHDLADALDALLAQGDPR